MASLSDEWRNVSLHFNRTHLLLISKDRIQNKHHWYAYQQSYQRTGDEDIYQIITSIYMYDVRFSNQFAFKPPKSNLKILLQERVLAENSIMRSDLIKSGDVLCPRYDAVHGMHQSW